jgi:hypothetical protein
MSVSRCDLLEKMIITPKAFLSSKREGFFELRIYSRSLLIYSGHRGFGSAALPVPTELLLSAFKNPHSNKNFPFFFFNNSTFSIYATIKIHQSD